MISFWVSQKITRDSFFGEELTLQIERCVYIGFDCTFLPQTIYEEDRVRRVLKISQIRNNVIDITVFAFDVRGHLAYIEQIVLQRIFDIGADIFRTINHKQHAWPLPFCRKPQFISNDFDAFVETCQMPRRAALRSVIQQLP